MTHEKAIEAAWQAYLRSDYTFVEAFRLVWSRQ